MKRTSPGQLVRSALETFSVGTWLIMLLAVISSVIVAFIPQRQHASMELWTFAPPHAAMYEPAVEAWNRDHPADDVSVLVLSIPALEQRMLSGFLAETSVADLIEAERVIAARAFAGPLDKVGFVDLTDRLHEEGISDRINAPSFSPWSSRGRIFGLPHDVHPVMLAYRADIVEAAGIDVSEIQTWDDFIRIMRPLMTDADRDGEPDRYLLGLWETYETHIDLLILQAGGRYFDESGQPVIASAINAHVVATIVSWCSGPDRIAADAPDFSASGNKLRLDGYVVASFMPDWMCNLWRYEIPQLSGKVKLMPLPAWEPGGRRTSVWGGTMLGISRTTLDVERAWRFAKRLYLSDELARTLYQVGDIITPIKEYWSDPIFDEPDPYFGGQAKGRMYIDLAPTVPLRTSSPYFVIARQRVRDAVAALAEYSRRNQLYDVASLEPKALELLEEAENRVRKRLDRNVFLGSDE